MITKRNGHGQTECRGCKNKGKYALNWDCFLYNFDNEPYCFDCLMEKLEQLQQENQELKKQVDEYKKQLKPNYYVKGLEGTLKEYQQEMNKVTIQQQEFINYLEDEIKELQKIKETELDYDFLQDVITQLLDYKEILQKYKSIIGDKDE